MRYERRYVFLIIVFAVLLSAYFHYTSPHLDFNKTVSIAGYEFRAKIAEDDISRAVGLSSHPVLFLKEAMLFIFDTPGKYGFWMKDMNFPIDIIWVDENKKAIGFSENLWPESYPQVFYPSAPAKYVLEVYPGFVSRNHIKVGDDMVF